MKFWRMEWQEQEGKFGMEETKAFVFQDRPEEDLRFVKDVVRKLAGDGSLEEVLQKNDLGVKCNSNPGEGEIIQEQIPLQAVEVNVENKYQEFWGQKRRFKDNQNVTSNACQIEYENEMFKEPRIVNIRSKRRNRISSSSSQTFESDMKIRKGKFNCGPRVKHQSKEDLDKLNPEYSNLKNIDCQQCSKQFKSKLGFKIHMKRHNLQFDHKCSRCDAAFITSSNLSDHHLAQHTDGHSLTCLECGKSFPSKGSLKTHKSVHTGERNYQCRFCDNKFRIDQHRKSHERVHTDTKELLCTICLKLFMRKSDLTLHMKIHLNQKDHMCEICTKTFIRCAGLRGHKCRSNVEGSLSFPSKHLRSVGQ